MDRTIWLTSDTHFNHDKDFVWEARGFENIQDMNAAIVERWNEVVKPGDTVYHLGDVMLGQDTDGACSLIAKLNGTIHLAIGNHDTDARIERLLSSRLIEEAAYGYRLKAAKRSFILTHYPTITANGNDNRVLGLYGHTHQKTNFFADEGGIRTYMFNVGVDAHNCYPINLEDIVTEIKKLGKE